VALLRALIQVLDLTDVLDEIELSPPVRRWLGWVDLVRHVLFSNTFVGLSQKFAAFVLAIETEELGIAAGLQDRVAQVNCSVCFDQSCVR
jgi:hypothetical protein